MSRNFFCLKSFLPIYLKCCYVNFQERTVCIRIILLLIFSIFFSRIVDNMAALTGAIFNKLVKNGRDNQISLS